MSEIINCIRFHRSPPAMSDNIVPIKSMMVFLSLSHNAIITVSTKCKSFSRVLHFPSPSNKTCSCPACLITEYSALLQSVYFFILYLLQVLQLLFHLIQNCLLFCS